MKVIEVMADSTKSWEDATQHAIERASNLSTILRQLGCRINLSALTAVR